MGLGINIDDAAKGLADCTPTRADLKAVKMLPDASWQRGAPFFTSQEASRAHKSA